MKKGNLGKVLVYGGGATAGVTAVMLGKGLFADRIELYTRPSERGKELVRRLNLNSKKLTSLAESGGIKSVSGSVYLDKACCNLSEVEIPDTVMLCIPNQDYVKAVKALHQHRLLQDEQMLVGISTRLGSGAEVSSALSNTGKNPAYVSISTYFAATKQFEPSDPTVYNSRAIKAKVFLGKSQEYHSTEILQKLIESIGTRVEMFDSCLQAEIQNANTFVHGPVALNGLVLGRIFDFSEEEFYLYRQYGAGEERGCFTVQSALVMANTMREINQVLKALGHQPVNLLHSLVYQLYPVPLDELGEENIAGFLDLPIGIQASLLYKWFKLRQVDPFAEGEPKPPHLSQVKLVKAKRSEGKITVPRIPSEDYEALVLIAYLADKLSIDTPAIDQMCGVYETFLSKFDLEQDTKNVREQMKSLAGEISC